MRAHRHAHHSLASRLRWVTCALATLSASSLAHAAKLSVGPGQTYATPGAAINAAADGDTIEIQAGTYAGGLTLQNRDLSLIGLGVVTLTSNVTNTLSIEGGTVNLTNLRLRPDGGRGLQVLGATVTATGLDISDNAGLGNPFDGAGLSVREGGDLTLIDSVLANNTSTPNLFAFYSQGRGGHAYIVDSQLTVITSTLTSGTADAGGAIHARGNATVVLTDSTLAGGDADDDHGGLIALFNSASLVVTGSTLSGGSAVSRGGAIYSGGGSVQLSQSDLIGHSADEGGAIYLSGGAALTWTGGDLTGNSANRGGGVFANNGTVSLGGVVACGNSATTQGGTIRGSGLSLQQTAIVDSSAGERGGAIYATGAVALEHVTLAGTSAPLDGAAVWSEGAVQASNTIIAQSTGAAAVYADSVSDDHTLWWNHAGGEATGSTPTHDDALFVDPLLYDVVADGVCADSARLRATSPARDAGDDSLGEDPDGTPPDLGAFGGTDSDPALWLDADEDSAIAAYDCDDTDADVSPSAVERCDGNDTDCDGIVDGPAAFDGQTRWTDLDGDGAGDPATEAVVCSPTDDQVTLSGDCDDTNPAVGPLATEVCNGIDDNCDGAADGTDAIGQFLWFEDADADGFGNSSRSTSACDAPAGWVAIPGDCADEDPEVSPAAEERCDGSDRDCDGTIDGPDPVDAPLWGEDADGDGWAGTEASTTRSCTRPAGAGLAGDCNDSDPAIYPTAPEDCSGEIDANCDGETGRGDADNDGTPACEDCDDTNPDAYPGAPDVPYDGLLLDCNKLNDWDADADQAMATAFGGQDCDDEDADIGPGAEEIAGDGIDQDCDGADLDPDDVPTACGCAAGSTSGGPSPLAAMLGAAALLIRRRRG